MCIKEGTMLRTPVPGTPVPGTPAPKTPVPKTPVPGTPLHKKLLISGLALIVLSLAALVPDATVAAPPEHEISTSSKPVADILFFYGDG